MTMLLALSVILYLLIDKRERHNLLNTGFFLLFAEFIIFTILIGSPFFYGIIHALNPVVLSSANVQAGIQSTNSTARTCSRSSFQALSRAAEPISHALGMVNTIAPAERTTYIGSR